VTVYICNLTSHPGQLNLLPSLGREMSIGRRVMMLCGWRVKAGVVHSIVWMLGWMVGDTGCDPSLIRAVPERFRDEHHIQSKALQKCCVYCTLLSVAKDSSSPLVLKLTLHSLLSCWEPDMTLISDDHVATHDNADDTSQLPCSRPSITQLIGTDSELFFVCELLLFHFNSTVYYPRQLGATKLQYSDPYQTSLCCFFCSSREIDWEEHL